VDLCSLLGINSVAEGIEDVESEKHLVDFGCTIGQGYYYSKPVPADEFPVFYNRFNQD
jgi:c-di-GMP phosphodiesterase